MKITTFSELTIDGCMALGRGLSSKALFDFYDDALRHWFHGERAAHDVIMAGAGTVRADTPELTVRHALGCNPLRVIPTNDGNIPADSHILTDGLPTLFAVPQSLPAAQRDRLTAYPGVSPIDCGESAVDLKQVVNAPAARGIDTLLVEGGSHLLHELFVARLRDPHRDQTYPGRQWGLGCANLPCGGRSWRCRAGRSSIGG